MHTHRNCPSVRKTTKPFAMGNNSSAWLGGRTSSPANKKRKLSKCNFKLTLFKGAVAIIKNNVSMFYLALFKEKSSLNNSALNTAG